MVIVYIDDRSFTEQRVRNQPQAGVKEWDLGLHAELVDRLTRDGARVVVFDIVFDLPTPPASLDRLAAAIRRNGKVVLAAGLTQDARVGNAASLPWPALRDAAAGLGVAAAPQRQVVRQYYIGDALRPSLPWVAASLAGAAVAADPKAREPEAWLNYYGPALTLPHLSYAEAMLQPEDFFRGKCVFIGALPKTLRAMEEADTFRSPHSIWWGEYAHYFPGVEVGATALVNLLRHDWLTVWPELYQAVWILVAGLVLGGGLSLLRPWPASGWAAGVFVALWFGAGMAFSRHLWLGWPVTAFAQIPFALAWSLRGHYLRTKYERDVVQRTLEETTRLVEATKATAAQKPAFVIPDHSLERLVGRGAYGEVWLARNAIGAYHVVKLVKRRGFPSDEPYEREFRGIQNFMPICRSHPGFVHLLHVGRNDDEKFFYCIMEAGDDQITGQRILPGTYQPRTLASEIDRVGMLPPEECLRLGLVLSNALGHLHRHGLIHRDIKPPNIIYVNGGAKFADIGLVTEMEGPDGRVSQVGTEGYLAPEGPGTPGADVYALGKVLYEAVMGRDRRMFPEVPTAVLEQSEDSLLRRFNEVICCACEADPFRRFQSAAELESALKALQGKAGN